MLRGVPYKNASNLIASRFSRHGTVGGRERRRAFPSFESHPPSRPQGPPSLPVANFPHIGNPLAKDALAFCNQTLFPYGLYVTPSTPAGCGDPRLLVIRRRPHRLSLNGVYVPRQIPRGGGTLDKAITEQSSIGEENS